MSSPIVIALDRLSLEAATGLAERVAGKVYALKIHDLFLAHGAAAVAALRAHAPVWVDLKFHDIPATVGAHVRRLVDAGVDYCTIHASGGPAMCAAAVEAGGAERIIAVTALTSLDEHALRNIYGDGPATVVQQLAHIAVEGGVQAIVCSPHEASALRDDPLTAGCRRLTPGIRPVWHAQADDQARIATPKGAMDAGATQLVVGRAIVQADDPAAALDRTLAEIGVTA